MYELKQMNSPMLNHELTLNSNSSKKYSYRYVIWVGKGAYTRVKIRFLSQTCIFSYQNGTLKDKVYVHLDSQF